MRLDYEVEFAPWFTSGNGSKIPSPAPIVKFPVEPGLPAMANELSPNRGQRMGGAVAHTPSIISHSRGPVKSLADNFWEISKQEENRSLQVRHLLGFVRDLEKDLQLIDLVRLSEAQNPIRPNREEETIFYPCFWFYVPPEQ